MGPISKNACVILLVLAGMISGCGLSLDVVKRQHRPGYYIDIGRKTPEMKLQTRTGGLRVCEVRNEISSLHSPTPF